jgi:DNA-binding CsgD family transcriptional regulator
VVGPDNKLPEPETRFEACSIGHGWRVVQSFEREGVRYLLLREDVGDPRSLLSLTQREREIVAQAASGSSNKEIAQHLGISDATVRVLMSRAANRLGVRRRKELLAHPALRDLVSSDRS